MKDKLKTIREACIVANPEIVDLKFGCEVKVNVKTVPFRMTVVGENYAGNMILSVGVMVAQTVTYKKKDIVEIIGRPIRLADVLLAIPFRCEVDNKGRLSVSGKTFSGQTTRKIKKGVWEATKIACDWNLLKDDLTLQDEPTIEFIYNLLK